MKTQAWTRTEELANAEFVLDDECIFDAPMANVSKRTTLINALMAATFFAGKSIPYTLSRLDQTILAEFTPDDGLMAFPAIRNALFDIASHVDYSLQAAVTDARNAMAAAVEPLMAERVEQRVREIVEGIGASEEDGSLPAAAAEDTNGEADAGEQASADRGRDNVQAPIAQSPIAMTPSMPDQPGPHRPQGSVTDF